MITFPADKFCFSEQHDYHDVTALKISRDEKYVAIGLFNGEVTIREPNVGRLMYKHTISKIQSPISSMKFHTVVANTLFCSTASGTISSWHVESGQKLWEINNSSDVTSFDISPKGSLISAVGSDPTCKVYHYPSKQLVQELRPKAYTVGEVTGHVSRVFATVFQDENILGTCGWDQVALIWDLRTSDAVQIFEGPKLSGESMCFVRNFLVTASCRIDNQIQIWHLRNSNHVYKQLTLGNPSSHLLPYSLSLSHDRNVFSIGGFGENRNYFFETGSFNMFHRSDSYDAGINCVTFSRSFFGYGLNNSQVSVTRFTKI